MKARLITAGAVLLVLTAQAAPAQAIAGGAHVAVGAYRFTAKIEVGDSTRSCTGALVEPSWLVTAASCFAPAPGEPVEAGPPAEASTATIGRTHLVNTPGQSRQIVHLVPREDRNLVLARLASPVTDIQPIALSSAPPVAGETLRVVGYGRTATEWVPDQLQGAPFTVGETTSTTVAVNSQDAATCLGDAGGPAFREYDGMLDLVAINGASWQTGCLGVTETRRGAVEVRTDDIADWIRANAVNEFSAAGLIEVASGEFTGDTRTDFVAIEPASGTGKLWVYPGTSVHGVLGERIMIGTAAWKGMEEITVGKLNRDAYDDVVAIEKTTGKLWLYPGVAGGGKIGARVEIGSGGWQYMSELTIGEFTGDSYPDLVAAHDTAAGNEPRPGKLYVYPGTSAGKLGARKQIHSGGGWHSISQLAAGRFGPDQYDDVIASADTTGKLHRYNGTSTGQLGARVEIGSGGWNGMRDLTVGHFNGDAYEDVAAVQKTTGKLYLYPGTATGTLGSRTAFTWGDW